LKSSGIKKLDRVCLAILVLVALAGTAWNISTMMSQERLLTRDRELRGQEHSRLEQADRNRKALQQALSRLQPELAGLKKRIPQQTDMGVLLQQLNLRMRERRITMATIQPQTAVPEGLYTKIPVRLVYQGSFLQAYRFLYDVETMDRLLVPEKITMTALEQHRECQVDLTLLVYERKPSGSGG
jgi:Tfp pilus assembly protein PilO